MAHKLLLPGTPTLPGRQAAGVGSTRLAPTVSYGSAAVVMKLGTQIGGSCFALLAQEGAVACLAPPKGRLRSLCQQEFLLIHVLASADSCHSFCSALSAVCESGSRLQDWSLSVPAKRCAS